MSVTGYLYLIALGSNQRHSLFGNPAQILIHAVTALETADISVFCQSTIISSRPVGPSLRSYANAAAVISTSLSPPELLGQLKHIEQHFGRRVSGKKWRSRTLDIDIILWSDGIWTSQMPALAVPHALWKQRDFVLGPASQIAPEWRDPVSGLKIKQLLYRFMHPKSLDQAPQPD